MSSRRPLCALLLVAFGCNDGARLRPDEEEPQPRPAPRLASLALDTDAVSLPAGLSVALRVTGNLDDGTQVELGESLAWASSDDAVASVDASGLVTTHAPGMATIVVRESTSGEAATAVVTVTDALVVALRAQPERLTVPRLWVEPVTVTARFSDGTEAILAAGLVWESSAPDKVVLDGGSITAIAEGSTVVTATHPGTGATARVAVEIVPYAAEGTSARVPVVLGQPHRGQVDDTCSRYQLSGLTSGSVVTARLDDLTADVSLHLDGCQSMRPGTQAESCTAAATGDGTLALDVCGWPAGGLFTLTTSPGGYVNEGSHDAPKDLTGLLPYTGQLANASRYKITGLTPNAAYRIRFDTDAGGPYLLVANQPGFSPPLGSDSSNEPRPLLATAPASASGELYVVVSAETGTTFVLTVEPGGVVVEGTALEPLDLTGRLPYAGHAPNSYSHYVVRGLSPGAAYTVSVFDASGDVTLNLFADQFSELTCHRNQGVSFAESCASSANAAGEIYLSVRGASADGTTYTIGATPGGLVNEGTHWNPVSLRPADLPRASQVNGDRSHYRVTGFRPGVSRTVRIAGASAAVTMWIYDDAGTLLCSGGTPATSVSCVATAPGDSMTIEVSGYATSAGATFTLAMN